MTCKIDQLISDCWLAGYTSSEIGRVLQKACASPATRAAAVDLLNTLDTCLASALQKRGIPSWQ